MIWISTPSGNKVILKQKVGALNTFSCKTKKPKYKVFKYLYQHVEK